MLVFAAALAPVFAVIAAGHGPASTSASAWPLPTVTLTTAPTLSLPTTLPEVTLPGVTVPSVTVPSVSTPGVSTPVISTPGVSTPEVSVPTTLPGVTVPGVITVPTTPGVSFPTTLPQVPGVTLPDGSPAARTSDGAGTSAVSDPATDGEGARVGSAANTAGAAGATGAAGDLLAGPDDSTSIDGPPIGAIAGDADASFLGSPADPKGGIAERVRSFGPPVGLLTAVVIFLIMQHRIDRRDPKLAGAPLDRLAASIGFE